MLPASQVVMLSPASVGGCELLLRNTGPGPNGISSATGIGVPLPPFANAKGGGGCFMVWNDVMQLLLVIGGTVGLTFKISWAIFQEIHNNKK